MNNKYYYFYDQIERSFFAKLEQAMEQAICPGCTGVGNECPQHGTVWRVSLIGQL